MSKLTLLLKEKVIKAARVLPEDIEEKLRKAYLSEDKEEARIVLKAILDNISIAGETGLPLCQDTGLFWCLVTYAKGSPYPLSFLTEALNDALLMAADEGYFRKSVVSEPVFDRVNTGTNLPPVINMEETDGALSHIDILLKGFGSENCSALRMLNPTAGKDGVLNAVLDMVREAGGKPCPPMFLGIGIGGTADRAAFLSKKALIRKVRHNDERYNDLEDEILERVNGLKIGAGGLGGANTALEANILYEPTHIAGLPVALSISCWADRKVSLDITEDLWKDA